MKDEDEDSLDFKKSQTLDEKLDNLSINDLHDLINNLKSEIAKAELLIKEKKNAKTLANKIFK